MRLRTDRLVPPGFNAYSELRMACAFLAVAATVLLTGFGLSYLSGWQGMFETLPGGTRVELENAVFPTFRQMLLPGIIAFAAASAAFLALAYRYVSYHYRGGSRCIYTMRRLPKRSEFFVRCCAIPLSGLVACQLIWRLLGLLMGLIYINATPVRWLAPGAWEQIVHLLTH